MALYFGSAYIPVTLKVGVAVGADLSQFAYGAVGSMSFTVSAGALPAGLSLSSAGMLTGTPSAAGLCGFSVLATDSSGPTDTSVIATRVWPQAAMLGIINPALSTDESGCSSMIDAGADGAGASASPFSYAGSLYIVLEGVGGDASIGVSKYNPATNSWAVLDQVHQPFRGAGIALSPITCATAGVLFDGAHTITIAYCSATAEAGGALILQDFDLETGLWVPSVYPAGPVIYDINQIFRRSDGSVLALHSRTNDALRITGMAASSLRDGAWTTFSIDSNVVDDTVTAVGSAAVYDPSSDVVHVFGVLASVLPGVQCCDSYYQAVNLDNSLGAFRLFTATDFSTNVWGTANPIIVGSSIYFGVVDVTGTLPSLLVGAPLSAPVFTVQQNIDPQGPGISANQASFPALVYNPVSGYMYGVYTPDGLGLRFIKAAGPTGTWSGEWITQTLSCVAPTPEVGNPGQCMQYEGMQYPRIGLADGQTYVTCGAQPSGAGPGYATEYVIEYPFPDTAVDVSQLAVEILGPRYVLAAAPYATGPIRSYLTQEFQNYFDDADVRIRTFRNTLDAQLLNAAAVPIETHGLRMRREIGARRPATCPLNLDNSGVYTRVQLPSGFALDTDTDGSLQLPGGTSVSGIRGNVILSLNAFDDLLPVPTRIEIDAQRRPVAMASPVLWQSPEIVTANPHAAQVLEGVPIEAALGELALPNRLGIWIDQLGSCQGSVTVQMTGEPAPRVLWAGQGRVKSETITTSSEGLVRSSTVWATVTNLLVYGLPAGASLTIYGIEIGLPQVPDPDRPYIDPRFRDVDFARYWQIDSDPLNGDWVNELYYENRDVGLGIAQSYQSAQGLAQLVVEPNTFGMFGFRLRNDVLNTPPTVFYFDRRERMPDSLASAALTVEPYFGLDVRFNVFQRSPRGVLLYPTPYAGAANTCNWRLLVEIPGGTAPLSYGQDSNGVWGLGPLDQKLWQGGALPKEVPFTLGATGTYVFTLETRGSDGTVTIDSYPYANLALSALPPDGIALPGFVFLGIGFDCRQQLWGWTGDALLPLALHYDAYMFDADSLSLYLTDPFDGVQIA